MNLEWMHAILPVAGLGLNVLSQLIWYRLTRGRGLLRSIYVGFLAGALCVGFFEFIWLFKSNWSIAAVGYFAVNVLLYGALGYGYFHFINLGETGRRVRLMWELYEAPDGLSEVEILGRYGAQEIVDTRLGRLLRNGQVVESNGRYRIGRQHVLRMARILVALKMVLLSKRSEFD
ncbi:MAG: hypothetical protein M5U26_02510 [Planctomycetota bacterium]|nr:hypothetical protein [Planctomycetota bacterium]